MKSTMSGLAREAVDKYMDNFKDDIVKGRLIIEGEQDQQDKLDEEYARKKIEMGKRTIHPEKLRLIEKMMLTDKN